MSFIDLDATDDANTPSPTCSYAVDIVFVHGLRETGREAWTDTKTGTLWMQDLFPHDTYKARRLLYEYDAAGLISPGTSASSGTYDEAVGLVNNLASYRYSSNEERRPIIFICHEFGGLLVKRALTFAASRKSFQLSHVRAIYLSTFAVMFMATPHHGLHKDALWLWSDPSYDGPGMVVLNLLEGSELLQEIADQFAPLMSQFVIHNFWERIPTRVGGLELYVVQKSAAVLGTGDAQECGINATHSQMIKYGSKTSPGYRLIHATLRRDINLAAAKVASRWQQDSEILRQEREHEAEGLLAAYAVSSPPAHTTTSLSAVRPPASMYGFSASSSTIDVSHEESLHSAPERLAAQSVNVYYHVRRLPEFYMGRQEQSDLLHDKFWSGQKRNCDKPKVFVIFGLPGSGKSGFCLRFLEERLKKYWGIFWVDCTTEATADDGFSSLGQLAGKGSDPGSGRVWLSQATDPWLLVLDNANDPDLDMTRYIPPTGNGHILITSRYPGAKLHNTVGFFEFHGMDPREAGILLLKMAYPSREPLESTQNDREHADSIACELGYLALALKQAAHTIRQQIEPLERYLKSLLGCRKALLSRPIIKCAADANIIATWELPFTDITSRSRADRRFSQTSTRKGRRLDYSSPEANRGKATAVDDENASDEERILEKPTDYGDAVDLIHILPFLHFDLIPCQLFTYSYDGIKQSSDLPVRPAAIVESESRRDIETRISAAAKVLNNHSIVSLLDANDKPHLPLWNTLIRGRYLSMHPAIHQWARERLTEKDKLRWLTYTASLLGHAISENLEASGRAFRRLLIRHIDVCRQLLNEAYPNLPSTQYQAWQLEKFGLVYAEAGMWKQARTLQHSVVSFRVRTLGKSHDWTIRAKRNLASTNWNLFDVQQCVSLQYDIMTTQVRSRPSFYDWMVWPPWRPVHLEYCKTLDDLTQSLWLAGRRELSMRAGEKAVKVLTQRLGPDDPTTLNAMFNLGRTYLHAHRLNESERLLAKVLARRVHFFGDNHPDTLMARNEVGMNMLAQRRDLAQAESLVRSVLESRRRILGEEHAYTLWSVNDLSKIWIEQKRFGEAIRILEEIVPIVQRTLGGEHAGMYMTKSNLVLAYVRCNMLDKAKPEIQVLREVVPKDHPDWVYAEFAHAFVLHRHDGRSEEAERCCKQLLQHIAETKVLAMDNPRVLKIVEILLEIYQDGRRDDEVVDLKRRFPGLGAQKLTSQ